MDTQNMSFKFKGLVKIALILMLISFAYSAISYVRTYSKSIEPGTYRSFSVSGEGKVVAIPDVAQFSFSIITEGGADIAKLQEDNTKKANTIIDFIKKEGVEDKDIKTESYNLNPRYQYFSCPRILLPGGESRPCPPPEIVGYTVTQSVSVKIRDFEKIGPLLGGVVERGANNVSQLTFTIDDPTEVENDARVEAIEKARAKAEAVAEAGDFRLGRLLSIEEGGRTPVYRAYAFEETAFDTAGAPTPAPSPSIEPGSQDVVVNVTLVYEIR